MSSLARLVARLEEARASVALLEHKLAVELNLGRAPRMQQSAMEEPDYPAATQRTKRIKRQEVTPEIYNEIGRRKVAGESTIQIGGALGLSNSAVSAKWALYRREHAIKSNRKDNNGVNRITEEEIARVLEISKTAGSGRDHADKLGMVLSRYYKALSLGKAKPPAAAPTGNGKKNDEDKTGGPLSPNPVMNELIRRFSEGEQIPKLAKELNLGEHAAKSAVRRARKKGLIGLKVAGRSSTVRADKK